MAVGGICTAGFADVWRYKIQALANLSVQDHSLFGIDYSLAAALSELGDETLVLAGASVNTGDVFGEEERTGGVLGSPRAEIRSADGTCDALQDGFHLWAEPGGPGLAAYGEEDTVKHALMQIRSLEGSQRTPQRIEQVLRSNGLETGLLVFDGTGKHTHGFVMAFSDGTVKYHAMDHLL